MRTSTTPLPCPRSRPRHRPGRPVHPGRRSTIALAVCLAAVAAACGSSSEDATEIGASTSTSTADDGHPTGGAGAVEHHEPVLRLALVDGTEQRVVLVELDAPDRIVELPLGAPATGTATVTADRRFVLVGHPDRVTVVDGGTWTEGHGDHAHAFTVTPSIVGEVPGPKPTHLLDDDGRVALFFDGAGTASVFDHATLATGRVGPLTTIETGGPHHGYVVPAAGAFVHTVPHPTDPTALPDEVRVVSGNAADAPLLSVPCGRAHGEAGLRQGATVACAQGIVVLTADQGAWSATTIPYPTVTDHDSSDPAAPARSYGVAATPRGTRLVSKLGTAHLGIVDVAVSTMRAVDLGAPVSGNPVIVDETVAVALTQDDVLHVVDLADALVTGRSVVTGPIAAPSGHGPAPQVRLLAADGHAYVVDPGARTVSMYHLETDPRLEATVTLPFAPIGAALLGA